MKILFFCRFFLPHIGGVEKHVMEISKLLIKKKYKITVVAEKHEKNLKDFEIINGAEVYRIPILNQGWLKKFEIWGWLLKHIELIEKADIVHAHDVFFWYLPFKFLFPFKKIFTTFHGYEDYPISRKAIFQRKIAEVLSNGNICVGDFIKKWYGTKPTYTLYGGVRISDFQFPISNKIKKESAVFIGRLDEQTGIKTYASAVKIIRKKIPDFTFEIIGDGKFRKEIEKDFKVLGFQNNSEKYLPNYNFAFVSRYLSILEAMAAKRLIFAVYDNPLKEDYLRMTPFSKFIIICNSPLELISKISFYLNHTKEKNKIVESAFNWAKKNTWNEMTNTYLRLWKKTF